MGFLSVNVDNEVRVRVTLSYSLNINSQSKLCYHKTDQSQATSPGQHQFTVLAPNHFRSEELVSLPVLAVLLALLNPGGVFHHLELKITFIFYTN